MKTMKAILELEMPESCIKCPLMTYKNPICIYCAPLKRGWIGTRYMNKKHRDCPLKPVEGEEAQGNERSQNNKGTD